jgi:hypothetical protein
VFERILADHVGSAKIRFPLLEQRPEIQVHDIVFGGAPIGRLGVVGENGVRATADDAPMPMAAQTKSAAREVVDCGAELAFENACPDETGVDHFRKKSFSLALRIRERLLDRRHF